MNIGVYLEPSGRGPVPGGAVRCAATIAQAVAAGNRVELVHHPPAMDIGRVAQYTSLDLHAITPRMVLREPPPQLADVRNPWRRLRALRGWHAGLSARYDLFVAVGGGLPPVCHARHGVLRVTFPTVDRRLMWPWGARFRPGPRATWERLRDSYYEWEWRQRFAGYQLVLSNSHFTREWLRVRWGLDGHVLYPPVNLDVLDLPKRRRILSVGRFTAGSPAKKQAEMVQAFRELHGAGHLRGWEYYTVGGLRDDPADRDYFARVQGAAQGAPIWVVPNEAPERLRELFGESSIYWHAAGLHEDDERHAERAEHFGISTVEAMAAGCIPVVIRKGGQPEIVEHGASGLLWDSLDELKAHTLRLAAEPALCERLSAGARERARAFGRDVFIRALRSWLAPFLSERSI